MCIIIYKPKGKKLPSNAILKTCFDNNPHGAEFMYSGGSRDIIRDIAISKGYMSYNSLIAAITELFCKIDITTIDLILHFRHATQGLVTASNTHPFPVTNTISELKQLDIKTSTGIVHNGIIPFCDYNSELSDTMLFIKDFIYNLNLFNQKNIKWIKRVTESKFAIMNKNKVQLIGKFIEQNGIYYSNYSFEDYEDYNYNNYNNYNYENYYNYY